MTWFVHVHSPPPPFTTTPVGTAFPFRAQGCSEVIVQMQISLLAVVLEDRDAAKLNANNWETYLRKFVRHDLEDGPSVWVHACVREGGLLDQ